MQGEWLLLRVHQYAKRSNESLIEDGRSQSELRQGVTLEVMGEGESMGPLNAKMKEQTKKGQTDIKYDVEWNTLGEYLNWFREKRDHL